MDALTNLPTPAIVALGLLLVVQIVLEVWAVIDILRRPVEQITGGKKWAWLLIVLLVNLIGAIVYFVAGRKPVQLADSAGASMSGTSAERAVDALYGSEGEQR